eukprot:5047957-Amphidinium_carterae.1
MVASIRALPPMACQQAAGRHERKAQCRRHADLGDSSHQVSSQAMDATGSSTPLRPCKHQAHISHITELVQPLYSAAFRSTTVVGVAFGGAIRQTYVFEFYSWFGNGPHGQVPSVPLGQASQLVPVAPHGQVPLVPLGPTARTNFSACISDGYQCSW